MKFIKKHIIFSLLVLGIISLTISVNDSSIFNQSFVETELEESISEIDELSSDVDVSNSDDGGNNRIATLAFLTPYPQYFDNTSSLVLNSKKRSQKHPLFILYCCLKIDC
ncbi:hypothetical protein CXF68_18005 [Tenacibaculum sp. Bg11-29]|uniref:hypothetical protein n=1 Tax=Tenacibaculum sp. Bg11-29 TaxID=2058306 RepID=UPI000C343B09|nr:hypothetical protein [Tenacibaculum sp. Bg11-29]PKH52471.1 hypothetical protein CXF68_18005 [Tenacibaculum sp. Bg11-29]